jgi:hypothetical protein
MNEAAQDILVATRRVWSGDELLVICLRVTSIDISG